MGRTKTSVATALAVATSLLVAAGVPAHASTAPLVPDSGVLLGAYADPDDAWTGIAAAQAEVEALEATIGRGLDIDHRFYGWSDAFPGELERWDVASGRTPLLTWEPWGTTLADIAAGSHDALVRQRARDLRALGAPVFLRFAHEMNSDWYPWSGAANGGESGGPSRYVAAWRHVHDLFAAEGASNVVWVWSPNADSVPDAAWNHWTSYYPGDDYVDWVGIDGYNWGTSQAWSTWRSFADLFRPVYAAYADRKPIMIAETASTEFGGDKAAWIDAAAATLASEFPAVRALVWFHADKEQDWRVDSSSGALTAFRGLAGALPAGFADTTYEAACPTDDTPPAGFADVPAGSAPAAAVDCGTAWGILKGVTSTSFAPSRNVTRAQMATFLARFVATTGGSLPAAAPDAFHDDDESPHEAAIDALAAAGILAGKGGGRFDPDGSVSRAQMATFVVRTLEWRTGASLPTGPDRFVDDDGSPHAEAIDTAAAAGLVSGVGPGRFAPDAPVSRAQMAVFLARMLVHVVSAGITAPLG